MKEERDIIVKEGKIIEVVKERNRRFIIMVPTIGTAGKLSIVSSFVVLVSNAPAPPLQVSTLTPSDFPNLSLFLSFSLLSK